MKEIKKIIVPYGANKKIAEKLKVNDRTVRDALKGSTDTKLSRLIRAKAIKSFGGAYQA